MGGRGKKLTQRHLPAELTEQILRRLRVKYLLKFRSVCKSWKTLIDSHSFKLDHFKSSVNSSSFIWRRDLPAAVAVDTYHKTPVVLPIEFSGKKIFLPSFPRYTTYNDSKYDLFGVANGLVCLGYKSWMVIWNPSTRESRFTYHPHGLQHYSKLIGRFAGLFTCTLPVCAFGFDPKTEDYKFLVTRFTSMGKAVVMLYSVRRDTWNSFIIDFPFYMVRSADGFLDGCFYWFAYDSDGFPFESDGPLTRGIVKFDFNLERFDFIQFSGELAGVAEQKSVAVTTRGCLELITVIEGDNESRHCEIWEMGDDGMWSRKLRVGLSPDVGCPPQGIMKDGQIICERVKGSRDGKVTLFNPTTGSCKIIGDDDYCYKFPVLTFVESLFSINPLMT